MSAYRSQELEFASNVLRFESLRKTNPAEAAAQLFAMEEAFRADLAQQGVDYRKSPFLNECIPLAYANQPQAVERVFAKVYEWFAAHRERGPKQPQDLTALQQGLVFPPMTVEAAGKFQAALAGGKGFADLWAIAAGGDNPYFVWGNPIVMGEKTQYAFVRSDRYIRNHAGDLAPDFTSAIAVVVNHRTHEVTACPTVGTDAVVMAINGQQLNSFSIVGGRSSDFVQGGRLGLKPVEPVQMHTAMIHANPDKRVLSAHEAAGGACNACNVQVKCISQVGETQLQRAHRQ
ncbi:MAG: hypothetical protein J0L97_03220 [Alphaproteobacteria bacterium]|nr:hypothetical protein [Alphaproteobacteria bacterium]